MVLDFEGLDVSGPALALALHVMAQLGVGHLLRLFGGDEEFIRDDRHGDVLARPAFQFFAHTDEIALDIMMHLREKGLEAGRDYGLHGFDAIDTLKYISPRLNTVNNNVEMVAKEAIQLLFQYIDEKEADRDKRIIVPFELVDGETI